MNQPIFLAFPTTRYRQYSMQYDQACQYCCFCSLLSFIQLAKSWKLQYCQLNTNTRVTLCLSQYLISYKCVLQKISFLLDSALTTISHMLGYIPIQLLLAVVASAQHKKVAPRVIISRLVIYQQTCNAELCSISCQMGQAQAQENTVFRCDMVDSG